MINVHEFILLSKAERQKHIRLNEPCVERGGTSGDCRGLLAHILDTSISNTGKIFACHACHNGKCSNPYHVYWGTPSENNEDARVSGVNPGGMYWHKLVAKVGKEKAKELYGNPWINSIKKYGLDEAKKRCGRKTRKEEKQYIRSEESRKRMSEWGKGERNPQFGMKWIYNEIQQESIRVRSVEISNYLQLGWKIGRKQIWRTTLVGRGHN